MTFATVKSKRGRERGYQVNVRLSSRELASLRRIAKAWDMSISDAIRLFINQISPTERVR